MIREQGKNHINFLKNRNYILFLVFDYKCAEAIKNA
jgi:hypothetical protein